MNSKISGLFVFSIFALVFALGMISAATLANWDFDEENLIPSIDLTSTANLTISDISDNRSDNYVNGNPSTGRALSVGGWNVEGRYIEISIDTSDYKNLILSLDQKATADTGPTEFKIQYSYDGVNFNNLTGSLTSITASFGETPMHTFDFSGISALNDNPNVKFRIVITGLGTTGNWHLDNIKIEGTEITTPTPITHPSEIQSCISTGNLGGNLNIDIRRPVVVDGFGDRDKWYVFDTIEVEIRVKNNGPDRVEDILLGWGVYSHDLGLWIAEGEERAFDLRSGRTETLTISFKLEDVRDIEDLYLEGSSALRDGLVLYAWAQGEDEEFDFKDTCAFSVRDEVEIEVERDFVALHNLMHPETVQCGTEFQISANVWNLGNRDQDNVKIQIYNSELGINSEVNVGTIDEFSKSFTPFIFNHKIPSNVEEKSYVIRYTVFDRNRNIFETRNRKDAIFYSVINVQGNCEPRQEIIVTASLESKAQASQEMTVKIILTNAADITRSFVVEVDDYQTWAEISELPDVLTLDSGSSGEVLIRFNVKDDASGQQTFNAKIYTASELIATQPVTVDVDPKPLFGFTWFSIDNENWPLWAFGALNIILVIIIIIVAIRLARK